MASATDHDAVLRDTALEFEHWLERLETSRPFAKGLQQTRIFSLARKLLQSDAGIDVLYRHAHRFDAGGLFLGSDWDQPELLQASLVRGTLTGEGDLPVLECLSALRFLAIARGDVSHPAMSADAARVYLEDVIARNLDLLFPEATEVTRQATPMDNRIRRLLQFLVDHLGAAGIVEALAVECERVLLQRPIMIQRVEDMLRTVSRIMQDVSRTPRL
ncbi:MAG: hypothetical protein U5K76_04950 [Woeseiaceae bacterium]|nr:hypothetical protein [Woeseiaceae bacterium]